MKKKADMWMGVSIAILLIYGLFMMYPLFRMLAQSIFDNKTGEVTTWRRGCCRKALTGPGSSKGGNPPDSIRLQISFSIRLCW